MNPLKLLIIPLALAIQSLGAAALPQKAKQTDKPAIVFMVAGQSNAGGCGVLSPEFHKELGRDKKRPLKPGSTAEEIGLPIDAAAYTHSYIWIPGSGFERIDPADNCRPLEAKARMHGMELTVVHELEKRFPENDIHVIKLGPSGKSLFHDWNPERTDGYYADFVKCQREAMAKLSADYPEVRVIGLYWDQGEADQRRAGEYHGNLAELVKRLRTDPGMPGLKFFIRKHLFDLANVGVLVAAQQKVADEDPNCHLLDIDLGTPEKNYEAWSYTNVKNVHLSSKAFAELTRRLFAGPLRDASITSFDLYKRPER